MKLQITAITLGVKDLLLWRYHVAREPGEDDELGTTRPPRPPADGPRQIVVIMR